MGEFEIQALVAPRGIFFWQSVFWVQEEVSLNSARRGCGRWRRGGLGSLRGPGRRGAGSWWRRAEDQQAPEGPGF